VKLDIDGGYRASLNDGRMQKSHIKSTWPKVSKLEALTQGELPTAASLANEARTGFN